MAPPHRNTSSQRREKGKVVGERRASRRPRTAGGSERRTALNRTSAMNGKVGSREEVVTDSTRFYSRRAHLRSARRDLRTGRLLRRPLMRAAGDAARRTRRRGGGVRLHPAGPLRGPRNRRRFTTAPPAPSSSASGRRRRRPPPTRSRRNSARCARGHERGRVGKVGVSRGWLVPAALHSRGAAGAFGLAARRRRDPWAPRRRTRGRPARTR